MGKVKNTGRKSFLSKIDYSGVRNAYKTTLSFLKKALTNQVLQLAGVILAAITCLVTFTVPEIRQSLGLSDDTAAQPSQQALHIPITLGRGAVKVDRGNMLLISTEEGVGLVRFIFHSEGTAYEWRFIETNGTSEDWGSGTLYEKYERTPNAEGAHVVDVGGQLFMNIGPITLEWSYRSPTSGWVYFDDAGVLALDDSTFSTFDLVPYVQKDSK